LSLKLIKADYVYQCITLGYIPLEIAGLANKIANTRGLHYKNQSADARPESDGEREREIEREREREKREMHDLCRCNSLDALTDPSQCMEALFQLSEWHL